MPLQWPGILLAIAFAAALVGLLLQRRRVRVLEAAAQRGARARGAWLQAMLGAIPEPVVMLDDELRCVASNDAAAGLAAIAPHVLLQEPWLSTDDGRHWQLSRRRLHDPQGQALLLVHAREVTDLTLTRRAFAAQQDQAAVGSLTALFAHGANNRLTVILSCLEMIGTADIHGEDAGKAMELASGAARRLADDTSALLAGVRRQVPRPEMVHLGEAIRQASRIFTQLPGLELQVVARIADGVDLHVDPDRIEAALLRLLSFARRRGASTVTLTGEVVAIEVRPPDRPMLRKGRYCRLDVELVGATLSERLLRINPEPGQVTDRLFDPDGLELAAVESFVVGMRGQLEVMADSGNHPCIRLYLPYAAAA